MNNNVNREKLMYFSFTLVFFMLIGLKFEFFTEFFCMIPFYVP